MSALGGLNKTPNGVVIGLEFDHPEGAVEAVHRALRDQASARSSPRLSSSRCSVTRSVAAVRMSTDALVQTSAVYTTSIPVLTPASS